MREPQQLPTNCLLRQAFRATYSTSSQVASHVQETIDAIVPEKDRQRLKQATATQLAASIPKPILYHNFHVGESKHLIMGISLVDYASARGLKDNAVPRIVEICIREVEARGLNSEGIYRVSYCMIPRATINDITLTHRYPVDMPPSSI